VIRLPRIALAHAMALAPIQPIYVCLIQLHNFANAYRHFLLALILIQTVAECAMAIAPQDRFV
jgi:hypothetical protein